MLLRLATQAMGTRFELVLDGEDEPRLRAAGEAALECIERCDERYSLFRSDSLIARVNREAATRAVQLDHECFELLARCATFCTASEGAFDVAVGPLMDAWGFRGPHVSATPPSERGTYELDREHRAVRFTASNTALDLGGIAKGHALDAAAGCLRESGVACALLHGGTSSVVALGAPPGAPGWRVRLGPDGAYQALLRDAALSVSAPHGRTADFAGHSIGHILDPRSGRPAPLGLRASVVGPSAAEGDAWSTAALVLTARGSDLARLRPTALSILIESPHGDARVLGPDDVFEPTSDRSPTNA